MAGVRGLPILALIVSACIAEAPALAVSSELDGRPRPRGYPDTPTKAYGPTPPCYLNSVAVTCKWYGFSHVDYPNLGADCLVNTREALANTALVPPGSMKPYTYYYLESYVFDTTTNTSFCLYGCFDMSDSSPPPPRFAPPPPTVGTPPPAVFYPPPAALTPPPPSSRPPPPPSSRPPPPPSSRPPPPPSSRPPPPPSSRPPPPPSSQPPPPPPSTRPPPPALVTPPTPSTLPPDSPLTPTPPGTSLPPPPPNGTRLKGAGFLRPTGFVSLIISGALLILNGLAAF